MTVRQPDVGPRAQAAAEAHLRACIAVEDYTADPDNWEGPAPTHDPAVGPFCACDTCVVREVLAAGWPVMLRDAADLLTDAGHPDAAALLHAEATRLDLPAPAALQ